MFSSASRYRTLPDIVSTDAQGRALASKTLRLLPQVTGSFRHTVEDADRLDHLAYRYYQQPSKWWRIADANLESLSPQAWLGKEVVVRDRFDVTFEGHPPPWSELFQDLTGRVGVEKVQIEEAIALVPVTQVLAGQTVTVHGEQFVRAVLVTYNQLNINAGTLASVITALGFAVAQPTRIGQVGKPIIIPRDIVV